jgi:salicylate hydroxylase
VVHRAHFHEALHEIALKHGVKILVNKKVIAYNEQESSITLHCGSEVEADLIVAADGELSHRGSHFLKYDADTIGLGGIKSIARSYIEGEGNSPPIHTGFAAYRATLDVEKIKADPETTVLLEKPSLNLWIGEDRHVMAYTMDGGKHFNMVLAHVDHSDPSTWTPDTAITDMRTTFEGWDGRSVNTLQDLFLPQQLLTSFPRLVKLINLVDKTLKWPLMAVTPLKKWVSPSGKLIIIGDAAHAMVPYMSQGTCILLYFWNSFG